MTSATRFCRESARFFSGLSRPNIIYSGDGTGKIYQLDHNGKLLGWAQTGLGMGQTGCIIHSLHAEGDNVLYRGSCSESGVAKITIRSGS